MSMHHLMIAVTCFGLLVTEPGAALAEPVAQIVSLQGKGEVKGHNQPSWVPAALRQALTQGDWARTDDLSNISLLFRDQTQLRLDHNTQIHLASVAETTDTHQQTAIELKNGHTWVQTKNVSGQAKMTTPSATLLIRGTDWDIRVDADGKSTLTVLSGTIEFFNEHGGVMVQPGEQAVAEKGKAPVKWLISNPKERVQWVTAYSVDPLRHIRLRENNTVAELERIQAADSSIPAQRGAALYDLRRWDDAKAAFQQALTADGNDPLARVGMALLALRLNDVDDAKNWLAGDAGDSRSLRQYPIYELTALARAALLVRQGELQAARQALTRLTHTTRLRQPAAPLILADFLAYQGRWAEAIAADRQTLADFPASPWVNAHLVKLQLLADQAADSVAAVEAAIQTGGDITEPFLAQGEQARWLGDAKTAVAGYGKAIAINRSEDRGWFGLGSVFTEQEDARRARTHLQQAIKLNPQGVGYHGEQGTLETFANNFDAAENDFNLALQHYPDDYIALTGDGVRLLKRGETDAALQRFLKASLLEPRYARAHLYTAIAYYQLGRKQPALDEIAKAKELDSNDPLPDMIASMIHTDYFDLAEAVKASREANRLMPYLKSMNQLANNQKGVASIGSAMTFWGMKDWAMHYAQNAYYPYWAGSHLLLSDLYSGQFAKNSELFQGYLADPTVFGASNRYQNLIHRPGNYQSYNFTVAQDKDIVNYTPKVTFNGYANATIPIAYFAEFDNKIKDSRNGTAFEYNENTPSFTVALGLQPTNELRLFSYASRNFIGSDYRNQTIPALKYQLQSGDMAVGGSYAFSPTSMLRVKYDENRIEGGQTYANRLEGIPISNVYKDREIARDYQLAWQTRASDALELHLGFEHATSPEFNFLTETAVYSPQLKFTYYNNNARLSETTQSGYLSSKLNFAERSYLQFDAVYTEYEKSLDGSIADYRHPNDPTTLANRSYAVKRFSPRVGLAWNFDPDHTLRLAYQNWVKPSSASTLGPVATAGIPLDENLTRFGGILDRVIAMLESEWSPSFYTVLSYDHKHAKNTGGYDVSLAENLANLTKIRQRSLLDEINSQTGNAGAEYNNLQFNDTASMDQIRLSANQALTTSLSATASYLYTDSDISSSYRATDSNPRQHYYLPRHQAILGTTWVSPLRVRINAELNWRSRAYTLLNPEHANSAYVAGNLTAYWETQDKRLSLSTFVRDIFSPHDNTFYGISATYRF